MWGSSLQIWKGGESLSNIDYQIERSNISPVAALTNVIVDTMIFKSGKSSYNNATGVTNGFASAGLTIKKNK